MLLLGRLARDVNFRGMGIGELLLRDALERCLEAQLRVGAIAVVVEAIDDAAARFYTRYGFIELHTGANRLFITMETIAQAASNGKV